MRAGVRGGCGDRRGGRPCCASAGTGRARARVRRAQADRDRRPGFGGPRPDGRRRCDRRGPAGAQPDARRRTEPVPPPRRVRAHAVGARLDGRAVPASGEVVRLARGGGCPVPGRAFGERAYAGAGAPIRSAPARCRQAGDPAGQRRGSDHVRRPRRRRRGGRGRRARAPAGQRAPARVRGGAHPQPPAARLPRPRDAHQPAGDISLPARLRAGSGRRDAAQRRRSAGHARTWCRRGDRPPSGVGARAARRSIGVAGRASAAAGSRRRARAGGGPAARPRARAGPRGARGSELRRRDQLTRAGDRSGARDC